MGKRTAALAGVLLLAVLWSSDVLALNPMGPPVAGLSKGQLEAGVDYSYSQFGLDFDFQSGSGPMPDFSEDNMKMDILAARFGYGITKSIEALARVGGARVRMAEDDERFSGDGVVFGLGGKVTFLERDKINLGGLVQADWIRTDGDWSGTDLGGEEEIYWEGDVDLNIMELHIAVGPRYEWKDWLAIYGGPFWYYVDGEKKYVETVGSPGWREKYDLEASSDFGGYIGAQVTLPSHVGMTVEWQKTSDDDVLGFGAVWRF